MGRQGQVAWELRRTLSVLGEVHALGRESLDPDDPSAWGRAVRELRPDMVVNAVAYTAVDLAETEPERAQRANAELPGEVSRAASQVGARMIHYSTDYVFDGTGTVPYREEDRTNPLGVYGRTKLLGEEAVLADDRHCVIRLCWVYGTRGRNFLLTVRRLAGEGKPLRIVSDQRGCPTWSRDIAEATGQAARQLLVARDAEGGLFHLASGGQTTWHGFASEILSLMESPSQAEAISTVEYPTPARRPAYSVLANDKFAARFGVRVPDWRGQVALALEG